MLLFLLLRFSKAIESHHITAIDMMPPTDRLKQLGTMVKRQTKYMELYLID